MPGYDERDSSPRLRHELHGAHGSRLWRHPRDRSDRYVDLKYWTDLAQLLERGKFDALFLADVLGPYDVYQGRADAAIRQGIQTPVNDPLLLVSAMAHVTEHLGFGVTCALTYEHPYLFARRASTLDHLTKGRFGWNVVSGYLESAARNFGFDQQTAHDDRYELAEEYLQVCYKLWEPDAVKRDRRKGIFADPAQVHEIVQGDTVKLHFHDANEYWIIIKGKGTATSEDLTYELGPADMLMTKAGDEHSLVVTEEMVAVCYCGVMPPGGRFGYKLRLVGQSTSDS
jgi:mannose-6-phosphate isomerase-like protein (cupin superfamily)